MSDIETLAILPSGLAFVDQTYACAVRGRENDPPRILLDVIDVHQDSATEQWLSLGDTVDVSGHTWRFADIRYGNGYGQWQVTLRRVPQGSPPFVPSPPTAEQVWQTVELQPFGELAEAQLAELEHDLGRALPPRYRQWLAETNGAAPATEVWIKDSYFTLFPFQPLLGLHPDTRHQDLRFGEERRQVWLPDSFIVIAVATGGLLVVGTSAAWYDSILLLPDLACQGADAYGRLGYATRGEYVATKLIPLSSGIRSFCFDLQPAPELPPARLAPATDGGAGAGGAGKTPPR
ncbi:MAG: SMI1/KNR4 family protein [Dactylosporangium sp.]|nr:SMI1/KNR4 family protein [Dactylosporangium sp.]NNJ61620.1 SMI1/KNR4 family protein [Dactylosporangium sp.]